ncbi:hypothetical protein [Paenibacillus abyssi]|uniref:Uncharacterized protein n=1 Tax=Paenibacillus abyssi TaxID=1340531 RepID=A0A917FVM1_9BACL|nr:hypothetical protein [Paenibacillus abyssi]GGG05441.1 hypothetical protein GCM10010916_23140 [Paenibacillus abyssi]
MEILVPKILRKRETLFDDARVKSTKEFPYDNRRKIVSQLWSDSGYNFLTYFIPKKGLDNVNKESMIIDLNSKGISIDSTLPCSLDTCLDSEGMECWRLTLTIGESEE